MKARVTRQREAGSAGALGGGCVRACAVPVSRAEEQLLQGDRDQDEGGTWRVSTEDGPLMSGVDVGRSAQLGRTRRVNVRAMVCVGLDGWCIASATGGWSGSRQWEVGSKE